MIGTSYDMSTLLTNKAQFNIEDYYNASRYSDMFYDSAEGALGSPSRTSAVYMAPTQISVTQTNPSISNASLVGSRGTES
jgi:hypothetical protein